MPPRDSAPPSDQTPTDVGQEDVAPVLIDGRYVLESILGRGGMSVVHLAEHVDIGRKVALKILHPPRDLSDDYDFAEWFRTEARTLASFQHPNVVTLHDFGRAGPEAYYLAMEFVDGPSLAELVREGPLEPAHAARLMRQVCLALQYTHQRGITHRDIKPSNLLVTKDDQGAELVKVIDFGIAEVHASAGAPAEDVLIGSPHCMSPEQIEGGRAGPASDIYAVGIVLFRVIVGRYPFHGPKPRDTLVSHLTRPVPSMRQAAPDREIPKALDLVVARCLAKLPEQRFADMGELIAHLDAFLEGVDGQGAESLVIRRAEVPEALAPVAPTPPPARTGPLVAVLGVVAAMALTAVVLWAVQYATPTSPPPVEAPPPAAQQATTTPQATPTPAPAPAPEPSAAPPPSEAPVDGLRPDAPAPAPRVEPLATPEARPPARRVEAPVTPKTRAATPPPPPRDEPVQTEPTPVERTKQGEEVPEGYEGMPDF